MLDKKSYIIVGVGSFGLSLIKTLSHTNVELLVIDKDMERLEEASKYVANTICANACDPEVLEGLGAKNFDGAIISIGRDLESRVILTIQLKEMGVPFVMVKSMTDLEDRILTKIGADEIVSPERMAGVHVGNQIARGNLFSSVELTENHSIADVLIPDSWVGKTIRELNVRSKLGVNIIGIRTPRNLKVNPSADYVIQTKDILVVLGDNDHIQHMHDKISKLQK